MTAGTREDIRSAAYGPFFAVCPQSSTTSAAHTDCIRRRVTNIVVTIQQLRTWYGYRPNNMGHRKAWTDIWKSS